MDKAPQCLPHSPHPAPCCRHPTFSQAAEELPFVMSARLVLHDAVSLGLSQNKLSSVGVPWMGGRKPCLGLEPPPDILRVMIPSFHLTPRQQWSQSRVYVYLTAHAGGRGR